MHETELPGLHDGGGDSLMILLVALAMAVIGLGLVWGYMRRRPKWPPPQD